MSFTITCEFQHPYQAQQAAQRLRQKGYLVSMDRRKKVSSPVADPLLVAYPYGFPGGNTAGNALMGSLPPLAGNGVMMHTPAKETPSVVTVIVDDTQRAEAKRLLTVLGGHIL